MNDKQTVTVAFEKFLHRDHPIQCLSKIWAQLGMNWGRGNTSASVSRWTCPSGDVTAITLGAVRFEPAVLGASHSRAHWTLA